MIPESDRSSLGGHAADQLRGIVRRIEVIEDKTRGLDAEKGTLYAEARACGFDRQTIRKLISRRRNKDRGLDVKAETLLDKYEAVMITDAG